MMVCDAVLRLSDAIQVLLLATALLKVSSSLLQEQEVIMIVCDFHQLQSYRIRLLTELARDTGDI
jgi:hypothetical protein